MPTYPVYKVVSDIRAKNTFLSYCDGELCTLTYHLNTTTKSATPIFVFRDYAAAYTYAVGHHAPLAILAGITTTLPRPYERELILSWTHFAEISIPAFWRDEKYMPIDAFRQKYRNVATYSPDGTYLVYDFTPLHAGAIEETEHYEWNI